MKIVPEQVRAYCNLCHVHCPIVCTVTDGSVQRIEPDFDHPAGGAMCVKGKAAAELLHAPERLRYPMRRTRPKGDPDPGWERISWDEALDTIAERLLAVRAESGPEAVAFSKGTSSGTAVSDAERWLSRLTSYFGTPNTVSTTHLCQWHRDTGNAYMFGVSLPTPDFAHAGTILLWGHNPSSTSLNFARAIADAQRSGARLIVVDPRRVGLAARADLHLQGRPGTDGAIALALIHEVLAHGWQDAAFVRAWTNAPLLVEGGAEASIDGGDGAAIPRLLDGAALGWAPGTYVAWDARRGQAVPYDPARGEYGAPVADLALEGTHGVSLPGGGEVQARPVFAALAELAAQFPPERAEAISGVPAAHLREAAAILGEHHAVCLYYWNGLAQHTNTTQNARAIGTLYALLGDFDKPGSNVLFPSPPLNAVTGPKVSRETAERRLGRDWRPLGPPVRPGAVAGYDLYRAVLRGEPYPIRALVGFGGNMLMSSADSDEGRAALSQLEFFAQAELVLTPTAAMADIVLPAATFLETPHLKGGYSFPVAARGHLQYRPAVVPPVGEARSDTWIIFQLAQRLGLGAEFWEGDVDAAYAHELEPSGVSLETLKATPGGITIPLPAPRYTKYAEPDPATGAPRGFATPTRKVELYVVPFAEHGVAPLPTYTEPAVSPVSRPDLAADYPLVWTCAKVTYFCHSQHRALPSLRRAFQDPGAELHPDTARAHGIADGDWMLVESPHGAIRVRARLTERVLPGVVCGQHGWWQGNDTLGLAGYDPFAGDGANVSRLITNAVRDPIGGTTPSRSYLCRVRSVPQPEPVEV